MCFQGKKLYWQQLNKTLFLVNVLVKTAGKRRLFNLKQYCMRFLEFHIKLGSFGIDTCLIVLGGSKSG